MYGNMHLRKLCISKFDKNLNLIWQKTYGDQMINSGLTHAVVLADGSIGTGAYSQSTSLPLMNENQNGVLLKVNKDGHFRWIREFDHVGPGNKVEAFFGIDQTLEGGFITCGNIIVHPNGPAWAVKTDSTGCIIPGCASSTVQVDSIIVPPPIAVSVGRNLNEELVVDLHPNPVTHLLYINIPNNADPQKFKIKLTDGVGREKLFIQVKEFPLVLDLKDCNNGIYFIQVFKEGILQKSLKVLKN